MYRYLVVRSDETHGESVAAEALVGMVGALPGLRRTGRAEFAGEGELGWVRIVLAQCGPEGNYAVFPDRIADSINRVEFICSTVEGKAAVAAQEALAHRLAGRLGWEVADDETGEVLRPRGGG